MTTLTLLCSLLLFTTAFAAPNRSNPDVQTRDAVDDFQKWSEKTQAERRNSQTDVQTRVTRAANQQQQESMLGDLTQQSSGSLVAPNDDLPTSLIIGGDSSRNTQRPAETPRTVLPANLASGTSQVTESPTAQRQVIGDSITNLGTELGGYFTTEPPSFWDRVGTGIVSTYNKAVKKAEDVAHSVRESIEG